MAGIIGLSIWRATDPSVVRNLYVASSEQSMPTRKKYSPGDQVAGSRKTVHLLTSMCIQIQLTAKVSWIESAQRMACHLSDSDTTITFKATLPSSSPCLAAFAANLKAFSPSSSLTRCVTNPSAIP